MSPWSCWAPGRCSTTRSTETYRRYLLRRLGEGIDILSEGGRHRTVLLGVPCYGRSPAAVDPRLGDVRADHQRTTWVDGVVREAAAAHPNQVTYIDLGAYLCPGGRVLAERDGVRLRADGVHPTPDGGRVLWHWLAPQLEPLAAPR
jgi:hypothetical protein